MNPQDPRASTLDALFDHVLVGVIRSDDERHAANLVEGVLAGGFRAVEITATTPGVFELIRRLTDPDLILGVGTVTSIEQIDRAANANARYIVSPHTDPDLIAHAHSVGLVSIPGAMTPTEILAARAAGADTVKVFPVSAVGGPGFVRWLRGPLPDVPLWVSGNVMVEEVPAYIDAGVSLIGLTSALTADAGPDAVQSARARARHALEMRDQASMKAPLLTVTTPEGRVEFSLTRIRDLPPEHQCPLDSVVQRRRGQAARLEPLLDAAGMPRAGTVRLTSTDGFHRDVAVDDLRSRGFLHYATDGAPLTEADGGPLRLYLKGPGDQCDNVKGLQHVEVLSA